MFSITLRNLECSIITAFNIFHPVTGKKQSLLNDSEPGIVWIGKTFYMAGRLSNLQLSDFPSEFTVRDTDRNNETHVYSPVRTNQKGEVIYKSSTRSTPIKLRSA